MASVTIFWYLVHLILKHFMVCITTDYLTIYKYVSLSSVIEYQNNFTDNLFKA